jgi:putative ABC transport system permease protein
VHGVDLTRDAAVRVYHDSEAPDAVVDDLLEFLNQSDAIILGAEFAARRGLEVGHSISLVTPNGVRSFTIHGLLEAEGLARTLGGRLVVMDLFAAERAFTADGQVSQIDILLEAGVDPDTARREIAAALPPGLEVHEPATRRDVIRKTVSAFQLMITALGLLAVVAGFVVCYSRLNAVFEMRTWQIGLLRAVGLSRAEVFIELLKESLLLGVAGTALGLALGEVIARLALPSLAATTALAFRVPMPRTAAAGLNGRAVLLGCAVGLIAALAAVIVPALRLSRRQPVVALRLRGRETPPPPVGTAWMIRIAAVALGAGILIAAHRIVGGAALGHLTTALIAVAVLVGASPVVGLGGRALGYLWERAFGPSGRFAARNVEWQPKRSALTVATLGLGLGTVLLFGILGWSFEQTIVAQLGRRMQADLVATSAFVTGGYLTAPVSDRVLTDIAATRGVAFAFGEQYKDAEYGGAPFVINAFDRRCLEDERACRWPLEPGSPREAFQRAADGDGVVVSATFAHQHEVGSGDTVVLDTPTGERSFEVLGVTSGQPASAVILERELYRSIWVDGHITYAHAVLENAGDSEAVADALRRSVGERYRLRLYDRAEIVDYFAEQVRQAFALSYLMQAVTFLLVAVAIGDTLAASVAERRRRYATLRALGFARMDIFRLVLLEGATIATLGLSLALLVGLALGVFWVEVQFPAILGWRLDLHLPEVFIVAATTLTFFLCLAGSLLPAWRAARLSVATALRND